MPTEDMNESTDPKLLGGDEDDGTEVAPEKPAPVAPEGGVEAEPSEPARDANIPRARFDEVNTKLHAEREARAASDAVAAAAQAELAALRAEPAPDIKALEKEYSTALMSGEEDQAAEIRSRINAELVRQATEAAFTRSEQNALQREADREYKAAYAAVRKDYPFLDPATGNKEAISEAVEWRDFYVAKGIAPADALTKAAERIAPAYVEPPAADPDNVARLPDPRKAAAIARGAAAAKAQPAAPVAGAGNRAVPAPPSPKSQSEHEALPDAERKKLLGAP